MTRLRILEGHYDVGDQGNLFSKLPKAKQKPEYLNLRRQLLFNIWTNF